MCGKLYLLAVVCVSFVQVRGDKHLEVAIEKGLRRWWDLTENGGKELENFGHFANQLYMDNEKIDASATRVWEELHKQGGIKVTDEARVTMETAKNSNMSESVIKCIDTLELEGRNDVSVVFWDYFRNLHYPKDKMWFCIKRHSLSAQKIGKDFGVAIAYAESEIRSSADVTSVERAVAIFELYVNNLRRNVAAMREKVQQAFNNYVQEVTNSHVEFKKDLEKTVSVAKWKIRFCILKKNAILAILLGLEK